jgi:hypothetical protein
MKRFLAQLSTILTVSTALMAQSSRKPPQVDLCTLMIHWQEFNGKVVRVKALFQEGAEQSVLSDLGCPGEPPIAASPAARVEGKKKRLRQILEKHRRAEVVLERTFRGPEPVRIDPKLPDEIKVKFQGTTQRYGHLGSFDMMIEITKIIEGSETAAS